MKVCFNCGFENEDGSQYCGSCGCKISNSGSGKTTKLTPDLCPDSIKTDTEKIQLAELVDELRNENRQCVSTNDWYRYSIMTVIPFAGAFYFAAHKEKNKNKNSYAKAAMAVNAVMSVIVVLVIAIVIAVSSSVKKSSGADNPAENVTDSVTDEQPVPENEDERITAFSYDSAENIIRFEFNKKTMKYPLDVKDLTDAGFTYVSQTASPFSASKVTQSYEDANKSSVLVSVDTSKGETCENIAVQLNKGTSCFSLTSDSDYEAAKKVFKDAASTDTSEYNAESRNGIVYFIFGRYKAGVSLKNNIVSSVMIKE